MLLGLVLLAGCSTAPTTNSSEESTSSTTVASQSSTTASSSTSSSSSSTTPTTEETATSEAPKDILQELAATYPDHNFPNEVPYDQSRFLNIAVDIQDTSDSVLYYESDQQYVLNGVQLNNETPFASYKRVTYADEASAKEAVAKQPVDGAVETDLGYGITGYQEGAAGSNYLSWTEGNWTFTVRSSNIMGQDPVPTAKEIVAYLETAMLPAPNVDGQVTIDLMAEDLAANEVSWQEGTVVYTIENIDSFNALKMAVSLNQ